MSESAPHPDPRPRLLVVEDDTGAREALAQLLAEYGFEPCTAKDGLQARELLESQSFDAIVSDVCMPGSDGFDLVRFVRELPATRDLPVVLISAQDEPQRRVAGLNLGADDFVGKPIDIEELVARVRAHLRRAERNHELVVQSTLDELTGMLNRRGILDALDRELARGRRRASRVSVLLVDVDDFKHINDTRGHATGDRVLRWVALNLSEAVRAQDRVGRLGGDEFIIVLPDSGLEQARVLAARLAQTAIGDARISVGAVTAEPGDNAEDVLLRADRAMYETKAAHHARRDH